MSKQESLAAFNELLSPQADTRWQEKVEYRRANKAWLKKSSRIAVKVLRTLKEKGISQKELAENLKVSPQYISKIVKGKENLSLETITKIELELGIELVSILKEDEVVAKASSQTIVVGEQEIPVKDNSSKLAAIAQADRASALKQNIPNSFRHTGNLLAYVTVTVNPIAGEEPDYSSQAA